MWWRHGGWVVCSPSLFIKSGHWTYCDPLGVWWAFDPIEKTPQELPPVIFEGTWSRCEPPSMAPKRALARMSRRKRWSWILWRWPFMCLYLAVGVWWAGMQELLSEPQ